MLARLQRLVPDRAQTMEVVLNVPSLSRFHSADGASSSTWMEGGVLRLFYGGALTPTYELNVIFRAIAILTTGSTPVPVHLTIAGRGESESPLRHLAANLGIAANVTFLGRIEMNDMPALIAACDIALAPTRRDEFTDLTISNKVYEGLAMGKIVLASQLDTLEDLIPTNVALRYESGNAGSAAEAIRSVVENPEAREARRRAGLSLIGAGANWEAAGSAYVQRLSALIAVSPAR
jgi:glycosyltransferase involved in cell wall biosynthesis